MNGGGEQKGAATVAGTQTERRTAKVPAFFYRLSPGAQRTYLRSDSISQFDLGGEPAAMRAAVNALVESLARDDVASVGHAAQAAAIAVCRLASVAPVRVGVRVVRPRNARGELHGLYYPVDPRRRTPPLIIIWMRTAVHHDVVKPKTFVRTLMHELVHHFDYVLLGLPDSFHTQGFFKRESHLVRLLFDEPPPA